VNTFLLSFNLNLLLFFSGFSLLACLCVVCVTSPVSAVLLLISAFISTSFVFLLFGAEFVAFIYVLVYVGAVLILFLWVVMTIPIKKNNFLRYRFFYIFFVTCLLICLYMFFIGGDYSFRLIRITPGSAIYPFFILFLKHAYSFKFFFIPFHDKIFMINFLPVVPDLASLQPFIFEVTASNVFYTAFVISLSNKFFFNYPFVNFDLCGLLAPYLYKSLSSKSFFYIIETSFNFVEISSLNSNSIHVHYNAVACQPQNFILVDVIYFNTWLKNILKSSSFFLKELLFSNNLIFVKGVFVPLVQSFSELCYDNNMFLFKNNHWLFLLYNSDYSLTYKLAFVLYNFYGLLFITISLILLVAVVGSVLLVKFQSTRKRSQLVFEQVYRSIGLL